MRLMACFISVAVTRTLIEISIGEDMAFVLFPFLIIPGDSPSLQGSHGKDSSGTTTAIEKKKINSYLLLFG